MGEPAAPQVVDVSLDVPPVHIRESHDSEQRNGVEAGGTLVGADRRRLVGLARTVEDPAGSHALEQLVDRFGDGDGNWRVHRAVSERITCIAAPELRLALRLEAAEDPLPGSVVPNVGLPGWRAAAAPALPGAAGLGVPGA